MIAATRAFALAVCLLVAASCGYAPQPPSGQLLCGNNGACPVGYSCHDGRTCSTDRESDIDDQVRALIGTWTFASGTQSVTCADQSTDTRSIEHNLLTIHGTGGKQMIVTFLCDWQLSLQGVVPAVVAGQECTLDGGNGESFTYRAATVNVTKTLTGNLALGVQLPTTAHRGETDTSCMLLASGQLSRLAPWLP